MAPVASRLATAPLAVGVGLDRLAEYYPLVVSAAWFFLGVLVVVLVGRYVLEPAVVEVVRRRNRNNPTIEEAISRYLRVGVLALAFFVGVSVAGYGRFLSDSALVIAAGTLAIGVAGQTVIGSLVSGLVLVNDPEFNIGNYIEWSGGEGTVQSITLRVTRVLTPNGELITIPNTVLTSEAVTRPFGRGRYRVVEHIGLAYEDDVDAAMAQLTAAATAVGGVLDAPTPSAYVNEFGSDAVVVRVHYWIEDPRRRDVFRIRSEYAREVKRRLDAEGITISPPSKRELLGRIAVEGDA
jgi:small conductance mechanosensitive channel